MNSSQIDSTQIDSSQIDSSQIDSSQIDGPAGPMEHACGIRCILPPYLLHAVAARGSREQREMALSTLLVDTSLRSNRLIQSALPQAQAREAVAETEAQKNRTIYDAQTTTDLPGQQVRAEGDDPTDDVAVNEAYDGLGSTFDLYWDVYSRNSIDGMGLPLVASVHFDNAYDNAFWDGTQMVFGDGDGTLFNRFTIAIDVIGHELAHGVTASEANLLYRNQSGALNESMSDVFGSLVKQYALSQTAEEADWLIGQGLLADGVQGVALRSMLEPGTAYDDPVLGKDPQPAHMDDFVVTVSDNGGVHINSGIPNKAFATLAVALGGNAWETAGRIWYDTLRDPRLSSTSSFQSFADLTADVAGQIGSTEQDAVVAAWALVGITTGAPGAKVTGAKVTGAKVTGTKVTGAKVVDVRDRENAES